MNYEEAYKEALERAKMILCNIPEGSASVRDIETIFPELRESEDERIRKELVNFILYKTGHLLDEEIEHRFVAYLEKQKEQKPDCTGCAKNLEGYINGRGDAERKLLDEYGILWMPDGELRIKPHWKPTEEQISALQNAVALAGGNKALAELYEQLKAIKEDGQ